MEIVILLILLLVVICSPILRKVVGLFFEFAILAVIAVVLMAYLQV